MHTIELTIMNQKVVLRTAASPERAERVARVVRERIASAEKRLKPGTASSHAAVLALFDLSEEYLDASERVKGNHAELREKTESLLNFLLPDGPSASA